MIGGRRRPVRQRAGCSPARSLGASAPRRCDTRFHSGFSSSRHDRGPAAGAEFAIAKSKRSVDKCTARRPFSSRRTASPGSAATPCGQLWFGRSRQSMSTERLLFAMADQHLPLDPRSWRLLLKPLWKRVSQRLGADAAEAIELESILRALAHWPAAPADHRSRRHEREALVRRIAQEGANPATRNDLDQSCRRSTAPSASRAPSTTWSGWSRRSPIVWRTGAWPRTRSTIGAFFDVNDLAAIRVEREEVFKVVHQLRRAGSPRGRSTAFVSTTSTDCWSRRAIWNDWPTWAPAAGGSRRSWWWKRSWRWRTTA